jgi:hypothetical protein
MYYYTGIGARSTPINVIKEFETLSSRLNSCGYILRSGAAEGADSAFEKNAGNNKEIYLPWKKFGGSESSLFIDDNNRNLLFEIAKDIYPDWNIASFGVKLLHARNVQQVLGQIPGVSQKSDFIVCWSDRDPSQARGTMFAVTLEKLHNIKVYNFYNEYEKESFYNEVDI